MNTGKSKSAIKQYSKINVTSSVEAADPHRLIQMLMQGALEKMAIAKGYMARKDMANKGVHISWAISIIEGLRASLNMDEGGEVANNLENMYEFMIRQLLQANLENDIKLLDEVIELLITIKSAWDKLPEILTESEALNTGSPDARP